MGECTDLLNDIKELLAEGLRVLNSAGEPISPALEDGHLKNIEDQLNKLDFEDETSALTVKALLELSEIKIGAVELEDRETGLRGEITLDGSHNALYVQSSSLLGSDEFISVFGEAVVEPDDYTLLWRINNLESTLTGIKDTTDDFTFTGSKLQVVASETNDKLDDVLGGLTEVSNTLVGNNYNISFLGEATAGTVGVFNNLVSPALVIDVFLLSFRNPSEETSIEIQLYLKETFYTGEATPESHIEWCKHGEPFTIEASPDEANPGGASSVMGKTVLVEGAYMAQGLGISARLVDGTGIDGAFDLSISIRER